MKKRIVVLGAGFGGMELTTLLSEQVADDADITLIDQGDSFVFGFAKLDVMFGRQTADAVRLPYATSSSPACDSSATPSPRSILCARHVTTAPAPTTLTSS